jgi:hypothetical protein
VSFASAPSFAYFAKGGIPQPPTPWCRGAPLLASFARSGIPHVVVRQESSGREALGKGTTPVSEPALSKRSAPKGAVQMWIRIRARLQPCRHAEEKMRASAPEETIQRRHTRQQHRRRAALQRRVKIPDMNTALAPAGCPTSRFFCEKAPERSRRV